jgi:hypothetical protein
VAQPIRPGAESSAGRNFMPLAPHPTRQRTNLTQSVEIPPRVIELDNRQSAQLSSQYRAISSRLFDQWLR